MKITLRGANLGDEVLKYRPGQNEYCLNVCRPPEEQCAGVRDLLARRNISYLHGYPSAIYEFLKQAADKDSRLVDLLKSSIRGLFYSSEYPTPLYRSFIESVLPAPSVSWYGHSEMAVLAYEKNEPYVYYPMPTYGFCEAAGEGDEKHLVATGFDNFCSPFIRYDTGDRIRVQDVCENRLRSFTVAQGREGDFILDARGNRIALTALIFGRHHRIFNRANFIQISQYAPGFATLWVTMPPDSARVTPNWSEEFDATHVAIQFSFRIIDQPVRTIAGKVPLLIRARQIPPELRNDKEIS